MEKFKKNCQRCQKEFLGYRQRLYCDGCLLQKNRERALESYRRRRDEKYKTKDKKNINIPYTIKHFTFEEWKKI